MKERSWSYRIIMRYALLQLPGLILFVLVLMVIRQWIKIPVWLSWLLVAAWVIKDAILFPFVWRAYDERDSEDVNSIIGTEGIAMERLDPRGYVQISGERWHAEAMQDSAPINKGERVIIQGKRGFTLMVTRGIKNQ